MYRRCNFARSLPKGLDKTNPGGKQYFSGTKMNGLFMAGGSGFFHIRLSAQRFNGRCDPQFRRRIHQSPLNPFYEALHIEV